MLRDGRRGCGVRAQLDGVMEVREGEGLSGGPSRRGGERRGAVFGVRA